MARISDAAKEILDWLQRAYLVVQLLGSGAVGTTVRALLKTYTHMSPVWITPLWLAASAATFALLVFLGNVIRKHPVQQKGSQSLVVHQAQTANEVDAFYNRLDRAYTAEMEGALRQQAADIPAEAMEGRLFRWLTVLAIYIQLEDLWCNIFASQINALQGLNNGSLRREGIFPFYAAAAADFPATYATYSFDQWLGFMRASTIIREDGDLIRITVKGRDFLKYLIDVGRSANGRTL